MLGWYKGTHAPTFPCITMIRLRIVAGIGQGSIDGYIGQSRVEQGHEAIGVRLGPTAGKDTNHQVTFAIEGCFQFGVAAVTDCLPVLCVAIASADVVPAGVATVQSGGVECRPFEPASAAQEPAHRSAKQATGGGLAQQSSARFLGCREMRNGGQRERLTNVGVIRQMGNESPVIGLQERLEDQAGKELRLRELLRTELVRVSAQPPGRYGKRFTNDPEWRFGKSAHISLYAAAAAKNHLFSCTP